MGEFDSFADAAFQLKTEGQQITLSFKQGVPTTGQGTVSWNIPSPANGCTSETSAYAGMVVLLSSEPLDTTNIPQEAKEYFADATANSDIHVGDKIGNAQVIGAFYECDNKGTGADFTTDFVVSDLQQNTPYYVAGYAVDCQLRYHSDGVRAYSDSYGAKDDPDHAASQTIAISNDGSDCIVPTDGTGLQPGILYEFDVVVDDTYPNKTNVKTANISIDGSEAGTYQDLLDIINNQIKLVDNPPKSPIAPNTGAFYWDSSTNTLKQFNGTTHDVIPVIVKATDPASAVVGDYWYDNENDQLHWWNLPSPIGWNDIDYIPLSYDPHKPTSTTYWFDGTTARTWNGVNWCDHDTFITSTDPSCVILSAGDYWFDVTSSTMFRWNDINSEWMPTTAVYWPEDPNHLSDGTYWFNLADQQLHQMVASTWNNISDTSTTTIAETAPIIKMDGDVWYQPSTEELNTWDASIGEWNSTAVLVWDGDPSDVESCNMWWNATDDTLWLWNALTSAWNRVNSFVVSEIDPSKPIEMELQSVWFNPTTDTLKYWDGGFWVQPTEYIATPTDPTIPINGQVWLDSNAKWQVWGVTSPGNWSEIFPVITAHDPTNIPSGAYWFNTTIDTLNVRNGMSWINMSYSTSPITPRFGELWYNTDNNVLYEWDRTQWMEAIPIAIASFYDCGIVFTTTETGSNTLILVPAPENSSATAVCYGSGFADFSDAGVQSPGSSCAYGGSAGNVVYEVRDIPIDVYLWSNVTPLAGVRWPQEGYDGKSGTPSYDVRGVGDDGTPDERRELMDSIRRQLGYPVVEVELTNYQLDTAIQGAIESFRKRSSSAYHRGFYFLDIKPQQSNYQLTNRTIGYDKIVDISSAHRFTSAFLSTAHGGGVYGQVVLQHLYNMGTYDLTSYHLVSQYVEQLEEMFATRLVFDWNERERMLSFYQSFTRDERVLLDCSVERTEQDLLTDRFSKSWIERYSLAESMLVLAQIRGKYTTLPGAGGGISLNASELIAQAEGYRAELIEQLDDFIVQSPEDFGIGSTFIFG